MPDHIGVDDAPELRLPVAQVLLRESAGARLLVVGSRSHNPLQGLALGSVALACVTTAPCPVLVVRPSPEHEEQADARTVPAAVVVG